MMSKAMANVNPPDTIPHLGHLIIPTLFCHTGIVAEREEKRPTIQPEPNMDPIPAAVAKR